MKPRHVLLLSFIALFVLGCSSSDPAPQQVDKSRELLGRESDVLVTALLIGGASGPASITVSYEVQNLRDRPISFFESDAESVFDPDTSVVTVILGSELPAEKLQPITIAPSEKRTFQTIASLRPAMLDARRMGRRANGLVRVRLHFLDDVPAPVDQTMPIETWFENVRSVITNAVPYRPSTPTRMGLAPASQRGPRRPGY